MQSVPEGDINQGSSVFDFGGLDKNDPLVSKLGFDLALLHQEYLQHLAAGGTAESFVPSNSSLTVHEGQVLLDSVAAESSEVLLAELEGLGLEHGAAHGSFVSGMMPIEALGDLAHMESLKFTQPSIALTNVGSTTSQGDRAMRADVARDKFDVDGSGVTVGVLSDSFDFLGGAATDVATGDLPGSGNPEGNTIPVNVLQELPFGVGIDGIDEGRAMLQLVHDVAPGAELAFNTAAGGQASFANGIINLANVAGADVIVDDIIYFAEPMFQDGIIAQAVDTVVAGGASYFSSAGNNARDAYESGFTPSGQFEPIFNGELHDFDPGPGVDVFQSITVPVGAQFIASFQWSSPFFSVSGGAGSPNDLDIILFDSTGTIPLTGSFDSNIGGDAVEVFSFENDGTFGTDQFNIAISNFDGPNPEFMKYVLFDSGGDVTIDEFDTASGTLYGHANADGAEAVGAARYTETPEFGQDPPLLESFSSAGPTPILFDTDGNPTSEERLKPEIVGPDGTNTTFFGSSGLGDLEGDGFPNFFGTSASAPHAAAVAALMLEAVPGTSPEAIYKALENTALDMDDPLTPGFDEGFDFASGYGFIQAKEAIKSLLGKLPDDDDKDDDDKDDDYFELDDDDHKALGVSDFLNGGFETDNFTDFDSSSLLVENFSLDAGLESYQI